jgi:hypothetical protein
MPNGSRRCGSSGFVVVGVVLASACANGRPDSATLASGTTAAPLLAAAFGKVITVDAHVATERQKGDDASFLHVHAIDGVAFPQPIAIAWTYGDHFAERPQPIGLGGFVVEPGCTYRLRGYETGSWRGVVPGVYPRAANGGFDDFGPAMVQAPGFHFANEFRILDGELLEHGTLVSPDPHGLSPRK